MRTRVALALVFVLLVVSVSSSLAGFWTVRYTPSVSPPLIAIPHNVCGYGWLMKSVSFYDAVPSDPSFVQAIVLCEVVGATGSFGDQRTLVYDFAKTVYANQTDPPPPPGRR